MKKDKLKTKLAKPHFTDDYLSLKVLPFGKSVFERLKKYCISAIFKHFDSPLFVDSPIIQKKLTKSSETIDINHQSFLRHTFHHFYFDILENKKIDEKLFPLTFLEQGLLFRKEDKDLKPFTRQTAFMVTDVHSFCLNNSQAMDDIQSVLSCVKDFERDWQVEFKVKCHVKDNSEIQWQKIEELWGQDFDVNLESKEEAIIALDFDVVLPDNSSLELSALEIYKVKVGNYSTILVDFTLGGIERILATIIETNKSLPFWLSPVQVICLSKDITPEQISQLKDFRIMVVDTQAQLQRFQKKYMIREIYQGEVSLEKYKNKITKKIPDTLSVPHHKPIIVHDKKSKKGNLF